MRRLRTTLAVLFFLIAYSSSAQFLFDPVFTNFYDEKLAGYSYRSPLFDDQGMLWFSEKNYLIKYNGYSKKVFHPNPLQKNEPLLSKLITSVFQDKNGIFWICYYGDKTITRFDPAHETFENFTPDSTAGPGTFKGSNLDIYETGNAQLIINSWGGGLTVFDKKTKSFKNYYRTNKADSSGIPCNRVNAMTKLEDGRFLVGFFENQQRFKSTPYYFDPEDGTFEKFSLKKYIPKINPEYKAPLINSLRIVNFFHRDKKNNIWAGTYSGLVLIDRANKRLERIVTDSTELYNRNICNTSGYNQDKKGNLWINTANQGLLLVDPKTKNARYIQHQSGNMNSLGSNNPTLPIMDPFGNMWVGHDDEFSIYNTYLENFIVHPWSTMPLKAIDPSAQQAPVSQMQVNKNGVVYISSEYGLIAYNTTTNGIDTIFNFIVDKKPNDDGGINKVRSFRLHNDHIIFENKNDVFDYDRSKNSFKRLAAQYNTRILFPFDKTGDTTFLLSNQNIYYYSSPMAKIKKLWHLPDSIDYTAAKSRILPNGEWLLLNKRMNKLLFLDPATKTMQVKNYNERKKNYERFHISSLLIDQQKEKIWLSTGNGLFTYNLTTEKLSKVERFGSKYIKSIIRDDEGHIWYTYNSKIYRWNLQKDTVTKFSYQIDFKAGNFADQMAQKDQAGNLYFISDNGLCKFDPQLIQKPNYNFTLFTDKLIINEDTISNQTINKFIRDTKQLDWHQNYLTFSFYTNQLFSPSAHHFEYRVFGLDSTWKSNASSNTIRLRDLNHGQYRLEVKATNYLGQETPVKSISFIIEQPFWQARWFYITLIISCIGIAFVAIRKRTQNIKRKNEELEQKVEKRTQEIQVQKDIIETKNIELTDSINYAKGIQDSILPSGSKIREHLSDAFVLFKPKDIVAGDFYWLEVQEYPNGHDKVFYAAADCTGHGVPGAIVSVVCNNALQRSIKEEQITEPSQILERTRTVVTDELSKGEHQVQDGMDISMVSLQKNSDETINLNYSGANNPLWIFRKKTKDHPVLAVKNGKETIEYKPNKENDQYALFEIKADKQPVGHYPAMEPFSLKEVKVGKGDVLYCFSDGYADQFGSSEDNKNKDAKKFKTGNFKKLLLSIQHLSMNKQKEHLDQTFENWRGEIEQVDDVCVFGVKM